MIENIKIIEGFSRYLISNTGYVFKLRNGRVYPLKPYTIKKGYLRVSLYDDGDNRSDKLVHRLVADAFIEKVKDKSQVNHISGDKTNNRADNLEWCDNSENQLHAYKLLSRVPSNMKPIRCVETGVIYASAYHAARAIGWYQSSIGAAARGQLKTTAGFHWEFCGKKERLVNKENK